MLTKEQIEWGKQNEKPFGLLTKEQQEVLRTAHKNHISIEHYNLDEWLNTDPLWQTSYAYRISPNYQPEPEKPEFEMCEVYKDGPLAYQRQGKGSNNIVCAVCDPDFDRFANDKDAFFMIESIAGAIKDGIKIYAKFRRK
jgi:hypothetical protein